MKLVDMHCDTISAIYKKQKQGMSCELRENDLHIDLTKMKQAGYMAQNFAIWLHMQKDNNLLENGLEMIDLFYREIEKNSDLISLALNYEDIIKNDANGKISALLTLEEGAMTKGNLSFLRTLYRLGVRMMTLTWNYENELASPNSNHTINNSPDPTIPFTAWGLTNYGIDTIQEMEHLGMILDVSHLSDAGFWDVIHHTKMPFVASHSNARSITNHCRNLSDDMIRAIANRGGVIGINFYPAFLNDPYNATPKSGRIQDVISHIKHMEQIGGIDCIGLGADFDGMEGNLELANASALPKLYDALHYEGFSDDKIEKIFSQNVLRVYKEILK